MSSCLERPRGGLSTGKNPPRAVSRLSLLRRRRLQQDSPCLRRNGGRGEPSGVGGINLQHFRERHQERRNMGSAAAEQTMSICRKGIIAMPRLCEPVAKTRLLFFYSSCFVDHEKREVRVRVCSMAGPRSTCLVQCLLAWSRSNVLNDGR